MENHANRRRNYYIKKEFQRNFILKFCSLVIAGSFISGIIIFCMSRPTVTTSFENLRLVIRNTGDYILPSVLLSGLIVVIVTGIAAIFITLFTSHKIAGPLYRIEKDVEEMASGNLKVEINLRQGDEIKPIAAGLNSMVGSLKREISSLKVTVAGLESSAAKLESPQEIQEKIKALKAGLDKFKT